MRYVAVVIALVVIGCDPLTGPDVRFWGRRPMDPVPDMYPTWYAEVEECLDRPGDYGAVAWFVADSIHWQGESVRAVTAHFVHRITIHVDHVRSAHVVRHEMVHEIMQAGVEIHDEAGNVPCEVGVVSHHSVPKRIP